MEGYIYQDLFTLPSFDGNYPVLGSWVIGQEPAGMGIREGGNLVTDNLSRFGRSEAETDKMIQSLIRELYPHIVKQNFLQREDGG